MNLYIQIISLLFSFGFGIFFSCFVYFNRKIIYNDNVFIKLFGTFLVVLIGMLLYFIILRKINYGIFHPYLLLVMTFGYYVPVLFAHILKK